MNIFVLDYCPYKSAKYLCDKHVPKMLTESAQMLASALRFNNCDPLRLPLNKSGKRYGGGYHNHPCTKWVGQTRKNFVWLVEHALQIATEHKIRFKTPHACIAPIVWMADLRKCIDQGIRTPFVQAMPDKYKVSNNAVQAYRNYYKGEKSSFAVWDKINNKPDWF